jgi:hypothetical protein
MTAGDDVAISALNILGEIWVRMDPSETCEAAQVLIYAGAALIQTEHPCIACRFAWERNGEACEEHRRKDVTA